MTLLAENNLNIPYTQTALRDLFDFANGEHLDPTKVENLVKFVNEKFDLLLVNGESTPTSICIDDFKFLIESLESKIGELKFEYDSEIIKEFNELRGKVYSVEA